MGWSRGTENGREIGYAVRAECDVPDCGTEIDRGLAYRCGGVRHLQLGDPGCGAYVCAEHNYLDSCSICENAEPAPEATMRCSHCGELTPIREGLIATHDWPKPARQVCPGSWRAPLRASTTEPEEGGQ